MSQYEFTVTVRPQYLPEQSEPDRRQFAFAYTITIANTGETPAQLISRHWVITDGDNKVQEVNGLGVVGHQPFLKPGDRIRIAAIDAAENPVFGVIDQNVEVRAR